VGRRGRIGRMARREGEKEVFVRRIVFTFYQARLLS